VTGLEWILLSTLAVIYLALLATVALITWRKGHKALFVVGFFLPFVWLIGSMMAAKPGTHYDGPMRRTF
jgi:uncharacterized membrane protein